MSILVVSFDGFNQSKNGQVFDQLCGLGKQFFIDVQGASALILF